MAVRFVDLLFSSGIKTTVDDRGFITATAQLRFNAFTTTPDDREDTIRGSVLIPFEKSRHPYFGQLRCVGIDVSRKGPVHYEVTADYASRPYKEGDPNNLTPLDQPTQINFFPLTAEEPIEDDIDGKPLVTVNGEPLEGFTRPISDLGVRLQKNFGSFDPASFYMFIDSVNSDTFLGFPPGTLRIASISADEQFFTNADNVEQIYWSVSVEIHARKPYKVDPQYAWYKRVRHEGYLVRTTASAKPARAVDAAGAPETKPVLLDEDGTRLPLPTDAQTVEAKFILFKVFNSVSFSSMGF